MGVIANLDILKKKKNPLPQQGFKAPLVQPIA
jgi:hypothetical protein